MKSTPEVLIKAMTIAVAFGLSSAIHAQQPKPAGDAASAPAGEPASDSSYAIQQSMDPNVWTKVMTQIMQGQPAVVICSSCHTDETVARYQREYGPYQAMMNPSTWNNMMAPATGMMNPGAMPSAPMMDPKQYEQFFNAWTKMMGTMGSAAPQGATEGNESGPAKQ